MDYFISSELMVSIISDLKLSSWTSLFFWLSWSKYMLTYFAAAVDLPYKPTTLSWIIISMDYTLLQSLD